MNRCQQDEKRGKDIQKLRAAAVDDFRTVLELATNAGHRFVEARAHQFLGRLLSGQESHFHNRSCVDIATKDERPFIVARCKAALASKVVGENPELARVLIGDVDRFLENSDKEDPWTEFYLGLDRLVVLWETKPPVDALAAATQKLHLLERLRDLQTTARSRAGLSAFWSELYYWISGRLLAEEVEEDSGWHIEQAFQTMERLRARVLLDALVSAKSTTGIADPTDPLEMRRQEVLGEIVQLNRQLIESKNAESPMPDLVEALGRLEVEAETLATEIARSHPAYYDLRYPEFATLAGVSSALGENEALLSYQLAPKQSVYGEFAGGPWLIVSTRDSNRAIELGDRQRLKRQVDSFRGSLERRDGGDHHFARRLHEDLLDAAVAELPPGIERLVIVPDAELHLLPFGALLDEGGESLASRYEISVVPSASLWLRWREGRPVPNGAGALVFADPTSIATGGGEGDGVRGVEPPLPPLPAARAEGRAVTRTLGRTSRLLVRGEASELALKQEDPGRYRVVHFAAHAVVDEAFPERSAIMLAPGADTEDGLLQVRDIVNLDLRGTVVVLSACSSASGRVLNGEGVMSLARAFFQAGAQAVVGSLWPLRDRPAAQLFDAFYDHLADGHRLDTALQLAQQERQDAGAAAADWAGVEVFGDGAYVPFPDGVRRNRPWVWASLVIAIALLGAWVMARRRG